MSKDPTATDLEALSKAIASRSGNTVVGGIADSATPGSGSEWSSYTTTVNVAGQGAIDISATLDSDPSMNVASAGATCAGAAGADGKTCEAIASTPTDGAWLYSYNSPANRQQLWTAHTLPSGKTLTVSITNYTETAEGKSVGPVLTSAGITAEKVSAVVQDSLK